jgi:peptidoglycan hydrolase-like protein with peptidoglycan-binding domain
VELQATLTLLGFFTEPVTGVYDLATATAVSRFQQAAGIKVDGLAGKETWDRLFPPIARSPIANQANPAKTATQPSTVSPTATGGDAVTTFPTPAAVRSTPAQPGAKPVTVARKPAPVALPVLKLGMRGSAVTQLQERLQALGFLKGEVDGVFGSDTEASVVNLQQHYQIEVDGVVGETTWGVLLR